MSTAREIYEDTLSSRYARVAYSADNDDICMYVCESILRSCTSQVSISGLVVKFLLAMQEPRVRFPADAILCLEAEERKRERKTEKASCIAFTQREIPDIVVHDKMLWFFQLSIVLFN